MINLWPLLLPFAASSGWFFARRQDSRSALKPQSLSKEYVIGLNYLLNEQPDKAVDIFVKLLEVDSDTVETHFALGNLFRRRGEVDRAIRIHQNLIARPQLSEQQRVDALMSLGQDYMSAGVLDRAERIFQEVAVISGGQEVRSLQSLLSLYQQEKSWQRAIDVATQLHATTGEKQHYKIAHFYCELCEEAFKNNCLDKAQHYLKKAIYVDKTSVRASLLQARIEKKQGRLRNAIKAFKKVRDQDPDYLAEIVLPLVDCHKQLKTMDECISYLQETLKLYPRVSIIFVVAEYMKEQHGNEKALDFVAEQLRLYPTIKGLNKLIEWHVEVTHGKVREQLNILLDITSRLLKEKPIYRCNRCGYDGTNLHWQCPSCHQWTTMKPIHGLEGD